jgi:hypothetical protein
MDIDGHAKKQANFKNAWFGEYFVFDESRDCGRGSAGLAVVACAIALFHHVNHAVGNIGDYQNKTARQSKSNDEENHKGK